MAREALPDRLKIRYEREFRDGPSPSVRRIGETRPRPGGPIAGAERLLARRRELDANHQEVHVSDPTVATRPLDEAISSIVEDRCRERGYTDLKVDLDIVRLVVARAGLESTPKDCRAALRRLVAAGRVIDERRPGGVRRLRPLSSRCPYCGSGIR